MCDVAQPSTRLTRKIQKEFAGDHADEVVSVLLGLPEGTQSSERIQTAMIVRSRGNFQRFMSEVSLVQTDWRDTLMGSGLEHDDWREVLDRVLGPA